MIMDNNESKYEVRILSGIQTIDAVLLKEFKNLVYKPGSPYIKFVLFPPVIEYLGACLDEFDFTEDGHSEERFNQALKKLFPNKYKPFTKSSSQYYMYQGFRCNMVHRLIPSTFTLTTKAEAVQDGNVHLGLDKLNKNRTILVLEDFYDDVEKAANKLKRFFEQGKAPKKKGEEGQLRITDLKKNVTK